MNIPKDSMAHKIFREAIGCRERPEIAIASLAKIDQVSLIEARKRLFEAQRQYDHRAEKDRSRRKRHQDALKRLRLSVLCRCTEEGKTDGLCITHDLLRDLAVLYAQASRCKSTPETSWVESCIEVMERDGLVFQDAGRLYITENGLKEWRYYR